MPYLDSIPLGWVKLPECACLTQILHLLMVIDASQSTSETFEKIKLLASNEYKKHFDPDYEPLPRLSKVTRHELNQDRATAYNNRAALLPIKLFNNSFNKINAAVVNQQTAKQRSEMFKQALLYDS